MIYPRECTVCQYEFTVHCHSSLRDEPVACEKCGAETKRQFTVPSGFINAAVEHAEYNPGLGKVTKNRAHRAEIAKRMGVQEVGNETPATLERDAQSTLKQKLSWDNII